MITQKDLKTPPRSAEDINKDLERAWVRHRLGSNRGEKRNFRQFDELLDERLSVG